MTENVPNLALLPYFIPDISPRCNRNCQLIQQQWRTITIKCEIINLVEWHILILMSAEPASHSKRAEDRQRKIYPATPASASWQHAAQVAARNLSKSCISPQKKMRLISNLWCSGQRFECLLVATWQLGILTHCRTTNACSIFQLWPPVQWMSA